MITKEANKIILGDAYEEIKGIADNSIDLIVTDPPYEIASTKRKKDGNGVSKAYANLNHELDQADVTGGIDFRILDQFVRVMKKINIYIFCNKKQILPYLEYFVKNLGCSFEILVWIKSNPIPAYGRNYLIDKEYCLYFRKNVMLHTTYESAKTYWITPTNKKDKQAYQHPTVKPLHIIKTLIANSSAEGDVILDPFLGSGTTMVASAELGRTCIGIEKSSQYFEVAVNRYRDFIKMYE